MIETSDCAALFKKKFTESFSSVDDFDYPDLSRPSIGIMDPIDVECIGVLRIIDDLKMSSSSGVDNIHSSF